MPEVGYRLICVLAISVLCLALLLGGATRQGVLADTLVQLSSLPLLFVMAMRLSGQAGSGARRILRWPLALIGAGLMLGALQLVPLPPSLWMLAPGRDTIAAVYDAAGEPLPFLPLSLDRDATARSLFAALPAVAMFLAMSQLGWRQRRLASLALLSFALLSVFLGLAQFAQGLDSPLRLYGPDTDADGFFANRNHFAALLYSAIPIAAAWAIALIGERRLERVAALAALLAILAVFILGLGIARSRAGLALALMAAMASLAMGWQAQDKKLRGRALLLVAAGLLLGAFLVGEYALGSVLERFDADITQDLRLTYVQRTWTAIVHFLPFGSGLGTFVPVYALFEDPSIIRATYANHAHNDWLELLLELGAFGLLLMGGFLVWLCPVLARAWAARGLKFDPTSAALSRAGAVIVALLLVHSLVDYPLRTTALSVVFAFAAGLMIPPSIGRRADSVQRRPA